MSELHINADSIRINDINSTDGSVSIFPPANDEIVILTAPKPTSPATGGVIAIGTSVNGGAIQYADAFGILPITVAAAATITADNGLTKTGNNIQFGGALIKNTTINGSNYWLGIFNNVGIGITPSALPSAPSLQVSKTVIPNDNVANFTTSSTLDFQHTGVVSTSNLYTGLIGTLALSAGANRVLLPETHYDGLTGAINVGTDFALSDGILSSVSAISVFRSATPGNFTTHGRLTGWAGFRVRPPLQDVSGVEYEFGGIDDVYGLYIEDLQSAEMTERIGDSWGIYQISDVDNNWMAGSTKIGGADDALELSAKFQVQSTVQGSMPFPVMTALQRSGIIAPAVGLHVYQSDAPEGVYVNKSSGWVLAY